MTMNASLVVSAVLATDAEQIDSVVGLVEIYSCATSATHRFTGRRRRAALDTARLCEAMLIEHLIENCPSTPVM
jgi:hypothetical protein